MFEERYRTMVRRCVERSEPFGVVLIREGREVGRSDLSLAGVGTMAAIREVTPKLDGTFDLLAVGTRRFLLRDVDTTAEPYLVGAVEELDEAVGDPGRARRLARAVTDRFVRYVALVGGDLDEDAADETDEEDDEAEGAGEPVADVFDRAALAAAAQSGLSRDEPGEATDVGAGEAVDAALTIPDDPTALSYLLGGILTVEPLRRQELLEAPTAEERLALLGDLLDREILLLGRRLETYVPDPRLVRASRN